MTLSQPVAKISPAQFDRLIRREFPDAAKQVTIKLKQVISDSEQGRRRISAAILRLANRDLGKLDTLIEKANFDFRDIVSEAEYPRNVLHGFDDRTSDQQKSEYRADWADYSSWLSRTK